MVFFDNLQQTTLVALHDVAINVPFEPGEFDFQLSIDWLLTGLAEIWQPFLLGCLLCGLFFGSVGYFVINILWRWRVHRHWQARKKRREMAKKLTNGLD